LQVHLHLLLLLLLRPLPPLLLLSMLRALPPLRRLLMPLTHLLQPWVLLQELSGQMLAAKAVVLQYVDACSVKTSYGCV
jgi:hypothetical protein